MDKSNIFVYTELSKLTSNLSSDPSFAKQCLKSQAGYFNIITPNYFSDGLASEWENITSTLKQKGAKISDEGNVEKNAFRNTIYQMSVEECLEIISRINSIFKQVKLELGFPQES